LSAWRPEQCRKQIDTFYTVNSRYGYAHLYTRTLAQKLGPHYEECLPHDSRWAAFSSYGVQPTREVGRNEPSQPLTTAKPMVSLLSAATSLIGDTGRATTSAPNPQTAASPGALSVLGGALGGLIGIPGVGTALGTIGDSVLSQTSGTGTTGRATTTTTAKVSGGVLSGVQTGLVRSGQALGLVSGARALGLVGLPRGTARMAKTLTRFTGLAAAAEALGLTLEQAAYLVTRPTRRRGITAASLRTTRRTLRQVHSITRSFKKLRC